MENSLLKKELLKQCTAFAEQRKTTLQQALQATKESVANETKSSAGDKHETARAHLQLEQEKLGKQLSEALKLQQTLSLFNIDDSPGTVIHGSLVRTDKGNFFMAVAAGKLYAEGEEFMAISPASPLGKALMGARPQDQILVGTTTYSIQQVI